ncbi:unnamed protein product [Calypogeia fissa]
MSEVQGEGDQSISAESYALEHTPTWAVAVVCIVFIALSLLMQRGLQRLGTWLLSSHKKPLNEALEKMKEELMLLGFISLLLTAAQNPMSRLCMPASWANEMLPCHFHSLHDSPEAHQPPLAPAAATIHKLVMHRNNFLSSGYADQQLVHSRRKTLSFLTQDQDQPRRRLSGATPNFCSKGRVPLMSTESLHQLHIFIFVMAVVHVFYSCFTMLFGFTQLRNWRKWEEETNVDNYNYTDEIKKSFNEEAFRKIAFPKIGLGSLRRQSTFVTSRTMTPWATTACGIWFNSFVRQFGGKSVAKSDYLTLRLGFIKNHNAPMHLNFHKYIMNSLEDDLKTVIGISGYLWVFVIFFMILNVHGWYAYFWMSFIPVLINLVIGAKLQHIITQLAMETAHAHGLAAAPIKPRDELFWFNNPHLLLYLIHFVLFQNAFELAFCIWLVTTFGFNSCFFAKHGFIISRVIVGILAQVLCSYSTLPLYALVSQMGSHYKKAIFADPVSTAVTDWRNKAKANVKRRSSMDLESVPDAEGTSHSHSHCQGHDHDHDHAHTHHDEHHHHCSSTLHVTSDGESQTQAHHSSNLTHLLDVSNPRVDGTKSDHLVTDSPKDYCGQCEKLSLTLHMDVCDREGNVEQQDKTQGSACRPPISPLVNNVKTNAVYIKISSEDTADGFQHWSLECSECKSVRALTVESSLVKSDGENSLILAGNQGTGHEGDCPQSPTVEGVQVQGKRKSIFLKLSRAENVNPRKGPSLDRMRRLPSREIREIRSAEATHGLEPFRPDLDIPELMLCTTLLNDPREVVEFAKSNSFSSKSRRAGASLHSHSTLAETGVTNQAVKLEKSTSFAKKTSAAANLSTGSHGHIPSVAIDQGKSPFTAELQTTNLSGRGSKVSNDVAEQEKAPAVSNPKVETTHEGLPGGDKE